MSDSDHPDTTFFPRARAYRGSAEHRRNSQSKQIETTEMHGW
jgi:hypothetical protein